MNKTLGLSTLLVLPWLCNPATAAVIELDPDGAGGDASISVNTLDWLPGAMLWDNGIPTAGSTSFTLYGSSRLGNFLDATGSEITSTGLNTNYEYTYTFGVGQEATDIGANTLALGRDFSNPVSFFEIWYDPTRNSDSLTGFGMNDGERILRAEITTSTGIITTLGTDDPMDQFQGDDYGGTGSVAGIGNTGFDAIVRIIDLNTSFFVDAQLSGLEMDFTASLRTAFNATNPSNCFVRAEGGTGASLCDNLFGNTDPSGINPAVGSINGISGPDFLVQSNSTASFSSIPMPGTTALALTALGVLTASRKTRKRR